MKRRVFLKTVAGSIILTSFLGCSRSGNNKRQKKPNIIFIYADDLGYGDISIHGCKDVATPYIDSIAKDGVRCTSGYVTAPACIPSRAGLVTGKYQQRFGYESNSDFQLGLPSNITSFAHVPKSQGYVTGMIGKWHVGPAEVDKSQHPLNYGFDEYFGILGNTPEYMDTENKGGIKVTRQMKEELETEYIADAQAREAVSFIERHKKKPFFLYLSFNAVHTPFEAPPEYVKRFEHVEDPYRREYVAMVSNMDDAVGQVLTKLRKEGLEENTLVFFLSDQGGSTIDRFPENSLTWKGLNIHKEKSVWKKVRDNSPFSGGKGNIQDGGIRVPFFLRWPAQLQAGSIYNHPVTSLDALPTIAVAAGDPLPEGSGFDGINLIPYLKGEIKQPPHEYLCWRWGIMSDYDSILQKAIRMGDYKLFMLRGQKTKLFNVIEDPAEKTDLAGQKPDLVEKMLAKYSLWDKKTKDQTTAIGRGPLFKIPPYYKALPEEFTFQQAFEIAQKISENGVSEQIVSKFFLDRMIVMLMLEKTPDGRYKKIRK